MSAHPTSWARVNAPVDTDIVPLVEALSEFPRLETLESCQGNGIDAAWVCFRYGDYWANPWEELAAFVFGFLAPNLEKRVGDDACLSVKMAQTGVAVADLYVRPESLGQTVEALRQIRRTELSPAPLP